MLQTQKSAQKVLSAIGKGLIPSLQKKHLHPHLSNRHPQKRRRKVNTICVGMGGRSTFVLIANRLYSVPHRPYIEEAVDNMFMDWRGDSTTCRPPPPTPFHIPTPLQSWVTSCSRNNLVPRAFPLKNGWGGKRPRHRLVTCTA